MPSTNNKQASERTNQPTKNHLTKNDFWPLTNSQPVPIQYRSTQQCSSEWLAACLALPGEGFPLVTLGKSQATNCHKLLQTAILDDKRTVTTVARARRRSFRVHNFRLQFYAVSCGRRFVRIQQKANKANEGENETESERVQRMKWNQKREQEN